MENKETTRIVIFRRLNIFEIIFWENFVEARFFFYFMAVVGPSSIKESFFVGHN
jgi:hypothetical protein